MEEDWFGCGWCAQNETMECSDYYIMGNQRYHHMQITRFIWNLRSALRLRLDPSWCSEKRGTSGRKWIEKSSVYVTRVDGLIPETKKPSTQRIEKILGYTRTYQDYLSRVSGIDSCRSFIESSSNLTLASLPISGLEA